MSDGFRPAPMKHQRKAWPKIIFWLVAAGIIYLLVSGNILQKIFNP